MQEWLVKQQQAAVRVWKPLGRVMPEEGSRSNGNWI